MHAREVGIRGDGADRDGEQRLGCPRCGQDLRGLPATWRESCPLHGRCPECGLDVAWGDIFGRRLDHPRWCLEGAHGPISWAARLLPHLFMVTIRPRAMLRRLRMEHRIRFGRLISGVVALLGLVVLVGWGVVVASYLRDDVPFGAAVRESLRVWDTSVRNVSFPLPPPGSGRALAVERWGSSIVPYREGSALLVLHPGDPLPPSVLEIPDGGVAGTGADVVDVVEVRTASGGRVLVPAERGWAPAGVRPSCFVSTANVQAARRTTAASVLVPPPMDVLAWVGEEGIELAVFAGVPLIVTAAASSLAFAVLPIARRRARVRAVQLARLSVYAALGMAGLGILLIGLAAATGRLAPLEDLEHRLAFDLLAGWLGMPSDTDLLLWIFFACVLPMLLAATWWSMAARHYLRMERPMAVGASVATVTNVAFVTAVVWDGWLVV